MQYIFRWDNWIFSRINNHLSCPLLNRLMPVLTFLGGARMSVLTCLILLAASYGKSDLGKNALYALAGSHLPDRCFHRGGFGQCIGCCCLCFVSGMRHSFSGVSG